MYRDREWPLDWVRGLHEAGCGAAVFLKTATGDDWFCVGGIIKSEDERADGHGRKFRRFFLTTVYDEQGVDHAKVDHKVSLDYNLFKGYGGKAITIKAFDVSPKEDRSVLTMLGPVKFLAKTNGYRRSGNSPTVQAEHRMSSTLVPFDTPDKDLPGIAKKERQRTPHCFPTQQTSAGGSWRLNKQTQPRHQPDEGARGPPVEMTHQMECAGPSQPSTQQDEGTPVITYRRKALTTGPSAARQKDYGGASGRAALREISEGSDKETEDDPGIRVDRHPQGNHAVDDEECGVEEDDVEEEKNEREREGEDREESMHDCEDGESRQYDEGDYGGDGKNDDAYPGDDEDGGQEGSADVEVDEGTGDRSEGIVHKRKRRSSISPTATTDKRAAKRLTVAASREALRGFEEAVVENVKNRKGKAPTRTTKAEKRPLKRKQMVGEGDSGEDAEGVAPRAPSEHTQPSADTCYDAINTTRCFFLELDEDGFAKKNREHIQVDVTKILPILEGDILFNHRTFNETQITPNEFDVALAHTYHWYAVAGQHTAEAKNRLIKDKSPAEKVYDLRFYSDVRVVYFDDDTKRGYPYVSSFDNTREERSIPRSFSSSVQQIRRFRDKRNDQIRPPGTVSPNDVEGMKWKKKWEAFMNTACKMTPDSGLMNSSLENDYCKDWTNKMRGYMNLAQCGETVWPLVDKFFDMYEKKLLPRIDDVRYVNLPGKVEGRLPGQYFLKDNSGKKVLYHCIKARKGPHGATVSIPDLTPSMFKLFGDMTAREKQVVLHHMMHGDVIVTSRTVPRGRCNMADLVKYTRRERYMVCMFNYILFKVEGRSKQEWNAYFFIVYTTILERYSKNGLTDKKWTEERDRILDDKVRKVPRRLAGPDEIDGGNGAGLEATRTMYKETPFHLNCFIYEAIDCLDDLRAEVNRISSNARHIFWEVGKRITTILPFEIEPKGVLTDNEEVVGTASGMKIRPIILDMSTSQKCVLWDDDAFSELHAFLMTCCGENWALIIFAPMKHHKQVMQSVYKWDDVEVLTGSWYRHYTPSTTVNKYGNIAVRYIDMMAIVLHAENGNFNNITVAPKLRAELTNFNIEEGEFVKCSKDSFIREDDDVMLLGRAHAGLIWELARAGHHVFTCGDTTKKLTYLSKFLDFYVKDPRNRCRFEKPQVEHRKERDIYYKLRRKREKVWAYLFGDAPQSAVDNDYVIRKSELEIAMNEYHGSHMGAFHMFVARCEHLYFNIKKRALSGRDYADLARKADNFNNIDYDEDTSDSDLDVPSRAARGAAERASGEEPQGSTNGPAEKASSSMRATRASEGNVETRMTGRGERNGVPTNAVGASEGIVNSQGNTGGGENGCAMAPPTAGPSSTYAPQAEQRTLTSMDTDEDKELDMTALTPKLVPGRPLPQGFAPDPSVPYLLQDKYKESLEEDWDHHIIWHEGVFESCVFAGKWQMAVKTSDRGWVAKEKKDAAIWHSVTETQIYWRVLKENISASEEAIAAKAKALFEHLRANKKLEFSTKFYDLASSVSYGSINCKIELASAVQGIDSINSLKTQDVIASNTIIAIARGDPACETDTRANAGHVQDEQQRACA
ncbi:hypothetical protein CBR_g25788 [Chara braunii]|uniref:Uncharacterized protein n=1 Tax=Chara braunii TaxID=69332 RepID=A0A388L6D7_CHABU|nr:hypothetical protein CBR_g25788 [Chara braunii]|eukprot:GBG77857.1 hypothetical protein CBR_g25788 [Chara braunii]